ncbi:acetyl-CoA carboxylase biotin carboxylase subunit [Carbonactinospora thermoautotrophica]|uniref:acetyl-CoA carboxylase biotin carboxylase subunit n=1 Tax=Carbonactinospora thermoautotrophica TaxID=1469144 RepID=UPI00226DF4BF|nr:acetyl-CoA carboxylase biotin carboxylase subunit [Carbonactinospora thermoautotrophica]MCX9192641.1 acetyl-CoA carboxylase biotin carboxylase subunit [Carbonactinospora thermoautotrophica]
MFNTVLIANRGEIALRVARTCRELGVRTVVVHSTADRESAAVRFADEAVQIGPPAASRSYLNVPAIIEAAVRTGAEAIHPGYGFLAEDPDFAEICEKHGITFVGPPPEVMANLGDKAVARALMAKAGLPVLPGSHGTLSSCAEAREVAKEIGYPVIIKAAAGGGGRGMAVVWEPQDFRRLYNQTCAHARAVFGDDRVYVERFVEAARHVEVQVLCDRHGAAVHLGERDCSVQRRHQKLLEETPAPGLPPELTAQICDAAVRGALAVGFVGAGTFEFLVDEHNNFYFIEVNCRIQVEHPVTEMVTGIDLVREQLRIAANAPLGYGQEQVVTRGAAVECRVNAEDPERDFAPTPGVLSRFWPPGGPFTRVDTQAYPGWRIPPQYDSLLAKVVVWAPDRDQALDRMDRALGEFEIAGVHTTLGFLRDVLAQPLFRDAKHTTSLAEQMLSERFPDTR